MTKPCRDWKGYTFMDGLGKVTVQTRNGYLSTGYSRTNEALPAFLRCFEAPGPDGKPRRHWTEGVSEMRVPELDDMFPNAVVHHYRKISLSKTSAPPTKPGIHA